MMQWRRRQKGVHQDFSYADIECCIDLVLQKDAVHLDSAKQAEAVIQAAKRIGLDFEYLYTPNHDLYHHTVQNLS